MATHRISIGTAERLTPLFSYKNVLNEDDPRSSWSLPDTILWWFGMTLKRDGFLEATASVDATGDDYWLELEGPDPELTEYGPRLSAFLTDGWQAYERVQQLKTKAKTTWPEGELRDGRKWKVKQNTVWDPMETGKWRFFLPLGMPVLRQRTLQFFHYPPLRLLDPMQDYLNDPVPARLMELQKANGVRPFRNSCAQHRDGLRAHRRPGRSGHHLPQESGGPGAPAADRRLPRVPEESGPNAAQPPRRRIHRADRLLRHARASTFSDLYLNGQEPLGSNLDTRIVRSSTAGRLRSSVSNTRTPSTLRPRSATPQTSAAGTSSTPRAWKR